MLPAREKHHPIPGLKKTLRRDTYLTEFKDYCRITKNMKTFTVNTENSDKDQVRCHSKECE